ncbi:MAG: DUF433 domain-containing protein [Cyanobacteria bacterium J06643_4]
MVLAITIEPVPIDTDAHGVVRVANTRVTLDTIVIAFLEGCTAEEIAGQYSSLALSDIYLVIGYYLGHQDEVDAYLAARQQQAIETRQKIEQRFDPAGIRARLLARQRNRPGHVSD